jgi:hypothetical protein
MKPRFWIYITLFVLAVLAGVLSWAPSRTIAPASSTYHTTQADTAATDYTTVSNQDNPAAQNSLASTRPESGVESNRQEGIRQYMESQNSPIALYGLVVDQDGNPVPGVKVRVGVRHWNVVTPAPWGAQGQTIPLEKVTAADGRFEMRDVTGDGVHIESISKSGYQLSPKARNHFGPSSGSIENPVIIRMWKEQAAEPLVSGNRIFGIDSSKVYTLDLITGKKTEGLAVGDLRVSITRPDGVSRRDKYPWSFSIEGIEGGVVESNDEFMYLAPESGYEPKYEMQLDPKESSWAPLVKKQFFLCSRGGGVYGRIQIEVRSIYNVHSALEIDYAVNPAGSRNLQPAN